MIRFSLARYPKLDVSEPQARLAWAQAEARVWRAVALMYALALAWVASGCAQPVPLPDDLEHPRPGLTLTPDASLDDAAGVVASAWSDALAPVLGPAMVVVGPGGVRVSYAAPADVWGCTDQGAAPADTCGGAPGLRRAPANGVYRGDHILIRYDVLAEACVEFILAHEAGHGLGAGHTTAGLMAPRGPEPNAPAQACEGWAIDAAALDAVVGDGHR